MNTTHIALLLATFALWPARNAAAPGQSALERQLYEAGKRAYQAQPPDYLEASKQLFAYQQLAGDRLAEPGRQQLAQVLRYVDEQIRLALETRARLSQHGNASTVMVQVYGKLDDTGVLPPRLVQVVLPRSERVGPPVEWSEQIGDAAPVFTMIPVVMKLVTALLPPQEVRAIYSELAGAYDGWLDGREAVLSLRVHADEQGTLVVLGLEERAARRSYTGTVRPMILDRNAALTLREVELATADGAHKRKLKLLLFHAADTRHVTAVVSDGAREIGASFTRR